MNKVVLKTIKSFLRSNICKQYAKYFVNGSILGLIAIGLQSEISKIFYVDSWYFYPLSVASTCSFLIPINFFIQRRLIFKRKGEVAKFILITFSGVFLVTVTSLLIKAFLSLFFIGILIEKISFIIAAVIISIPIFLLKRSYVFHVR